MAITVALSLPAHSAEQAQAVPSFLQSPPADIRSSRKSVSRETATVGDVLTYTITIAKVGGPITHTIMFDTLTPPMSHATHLTYTGPTSFFLYNPGSRTVGWGAILPAGPVEVTLRWQVEITGAPPGGVLTNTARIFAGQILITREAATFIQTPTPIQPPTLTATPTNTATAASPPSPTATVASTSSPTAAPSATLRRTVRPRPAVTPPATLRAPTLPPPTVTPVPGAPAAPTATRPANRPLYLPETGKR